MPKAKKASPFMAFVKERYPSLPINEAVRRADSEWQAMSKEKKEKYSEKCKNTVFDVKPREKLTSQGVPLSHIEKEKNELERQDRSMKNEVENIANTGRNTGELADIKFNFISVNYFSKTADASIYTPAEIALAVYSLKKGVINQLHSFVNPGYVPYGHTFETKQHSEDTHQLGVPPDVQGETNLEQLYLHCLEFIRDNNDDTKDFPPLFTVQEDVKIVESVLDVLKSCLDDVPELRIYPLHYLFYVMKKTTSSIGETKPPESIHITNAYLDRDIYEYQTNIACEFHEKKDRSKYCSLSRVIRWAYTFSDHLCQDLAIIMEPGYHIPKNADLDTFSESNYASSIITQPKIERDSTSFGEGDSSFSSVENFPALGDSKHKKKIKSESRGTSVFSADTRMEKDDDNDDDDDKESNPWLRSSRDKKCRAPAEESFSIDLSKRDQSFRKQTSSGRGLLFEKTEKPKYSKGRGLMFGD